MLFRPRFVHGAVAHRGIGAFDADGVDINVAERLGQETALFVEPTYRLCGKGIYWRCSQAVRSPKACAVEASYRSRSSRDEINRGISMTSLGASFWEVLAQGTAASLMIILLIRRYSLNRALRHVLINRRRERTP
jgi:hypothetical protein